MGRRRSARTHRGPRCACAMGWSLGPERSGGRPEAAILPGDAKAVYRRRKIVGAGRCGKTIETQSAFGHTDSIEVCVGAPMSKAERSRIVDVRSSVECKRVPEATRSRVIFSSARRRILNAGFHWGLSNAPPRRPLPLFMAISASRSPCCERAPAMAYAASPINPPIRLCRSAHPCEESGWTRTGGRPPHSRLEPLEA